MIIESVIGGMLIMTPIDMDKEYNEHLQEVGQAKCLADNMYFEARNQSWRGIVAVGMVTLNRVNDKRFPEILCEVVKQGPISKWWLEQKGKIVPIRHKCQFSWYCDGKSDKIP